MDARNRVVDWPLDGDGSEWPEGGEGGGDWDERGRWYPDAGEPGTPGVGSSVPRDSAFALVLCVCCA